jgi:hypothetical protein
MQGSCLCGAVRYEATGDPIRFNLDHCSRCRKSTGSAFGAWIICERNGFRWLAGAELVRRYVAPVKLTPPGYPRTFCSVCGGPVPYVDDRIVGIPAGTVDGDPGIRPQMHLFVDGNAPWYDIRDDLPQHAGVV